MNLEQFKGAVLDRVAWIFAHPKGAPQTFVPLLKFFRTQGWPKTSWSSMANATPPPVISSYSQSPSSFANPEKWKVNRYSTLEEAEPSSEWPVLGFNNLDFHWFCQRFSLLHGSAVTVYEQNVGIPSCCLFAFFHMVSFSVVVDYYYRNTQDGLQEKTENSNNDNMQMHNANLE